MCGINGIFAYHYAANPIDRNELRRTRDNMAARGPDGTGEWFSADGRVGFGHRRLAIIDLSDAGMQPMASADGKLVVTFNGEIETFVEGYDRHHRSGTRHVLLWLNAVGGGADKVEAALRERALPFIRGMPVPTEQLASLLVTPDAHLITLSNAFVGLVLPSKVHGCIASGRPVLFIGGDRSDVHRLCVEKMRVPYWRVAVGDAESCARVLDSLPVSGVRTTPTHGSPVASK